MVSDFAEKVYDVVRQIPAGRTMTYQEVAERIGHPKAYRAVALALSKNYDLNVPCHRVIRSDGSLGDYNRGGRAKKRELLQKEGVIIR